uniref:Protein kinase domain-containing protein n=1 Tax=Acrobeloides nanus TaxID=290746 RepID=A0A914EMG5_9BILA
MECVYIFEDSFIDENFDAQPELDKNPEDREKQRKIIAAPSVRRAKSSIDNETKQLQEARKKRRNTVFIKSNLGMDLIKKVDLEEVYDVFKQLGTGRFGYVQLAEHKQSKLKIALKFFPRPQIKQADFVREYNYSYFLSPHPNIIDTYEGMYQTHDESAFFFVQEFCPSASLREAVERSPGGLTEDVTRVIFTKVLSAMEFMHSENLVHRNLKAENILIFDIERYTRVKITDFGLTRKVDSTVKYLEYVNCYHAPELCETVVNEVLTVNKSLDIWSLGIIFYYCLKGKFPWQKASIMCKPYWEWEQWLKRKSPQLPKRWDPFSEKSLKLLKRCLNPKAKDRWTVKEMRKIITKERLLKEAKHTFSFDDHFVYLDEENTVKNYGTIPKITKKKSALGNWINNTWATMSEISEQVVSAQD